MKVEVREKSPIEKTMTIEVEPEKYQKSFNDIIRKVSREVQVPGFRKGKAPRNVIIRKVGIENIKDDLLRDLIPKMSMEAIEEKDLKPISTPTCTNFDEIVFEEGKPISFDIAFEIKPEFELDGYKGLELIRIDRGVDVDKMVEEQIDKMRQQQSAMVPVEEERPLVKGDTAHVDFESFNKEGKSVEGGSAKDYYMTLEEGSFIPGFIDEVIGKTPGDEWEFDITFPEDYFNKEMAGEEINFKFKLYGIFKKELPEKDDEFAKSVGKYETYEELEKNIRERIVESIDQQQKGEMQEQALAKLTEKVKDVPVPKSLIDAHLHSFIHRLEDQLRQMGKSLDDHLKEIKSDLYTFRKKMEPRAKNAAISELIIEKIVELEDVKVTKEDEDEELEKMAKAIGQDISFIKMAAQRDNFMPQLRFEIRNRKAMDVILDSAKIEDKSQEQLQAELTQMKEDQQKMVDDVMKKVKEMKDKEEAEKAEETEKSEEKAEEAESKEPETES